MSKKVLAFLIILGVIAIGILVGYYIYMTSNSNVPNTDNDYRLSDIKIDDECTEFAVALEMNDTISASTSDEKISPNAEFIMKKYYKECKHTIKDYVDLPKELVNMSYDKLKEQYEGWEIEEFLPTKIILYKDMDGACNEHYIVKVKDGYIAIYTINKQGEELLKEVTNIETRYLTENDIEELTEGIKAFGKEELNSIIEDFE